MSRIKEHLKRFYRKAATKQLDGIGIIEIILILVIIIGLILIFRNQIEAIMSKAFDFIKEDSNEINTRLDITPIP